MWVRCLAKSKLESAVEELAIPIAEKLGVELLDVEFVKEGPEWYLRLFIDKVGGINIEDCENMSHEIDPVLDELDEKDPNLFTHTYRLEISSSGDRPLKNDKDFQRNLGKDIEISFFTPFEGKKSMEGKLISFTEDTINIEFGKKEMQIERGLISLIKLAFKF